MDDDLLTVDEVAALLRVHAQSVRRWLRAGTLGGSSIGGAAGWRIPRSAVRQFVADRHGRPTLRRRPADAGLAAVMTPRHDDPPADVPIAPQSLTEAS